MLGRLLRQRLRRRLGRLFPRNPSRFDKYSVLVLRNRSVFLGEVQPNRVTVSFVPTSENVLARQREGLLHVFERDLIDGFSDPELRVVLPEGVRRFSVVLVLGHNVVNESKGFSHSGRN